MVFFCVASVDVDDHIHPFFFEWIIKILCNFFSFAAVNKIGLIYNE